MLHREGAELLQQYKWAEQLMVTEELSLEGTSGGLGSAAAGCLGTSPVQH